MSDTIGILAKVIEGQLHYGTYISTLYFAGDYVNSEIDGWKWFADYETAYENYKDVIEITEPE